MTRIGITSKHIQINSLHSRKVEEIDRVLNGKKRVGTNNVTDSNNNVHRTTNLTFKLQIEDEIES